MKTSTLIWTSVVGAVIALLVNEAYQRMKKKSAQGNLF